MPFLLLLAALFLAACTPRAPEAMSDQPEAGRQAAAAPLVIAHRGASGYLPEHTLEAKVLAHAQGADYIEQDVVMTRDDVPVVLHDLHLDRISDVAEVFPGRARADGRHYVVDFTLAELRRLRVTERLTAAGEARYPARFPPWRGRFRIHTLEEEIELIQGLNESTGRGVGIYPELKDPAFHRREGKDLSRVVLTLLKQYGYRGRDDRVYLQSFDHQELVRVRQALMPALDMDLKLVQLIGDGPGEGWMTRQEGLRTLAGVVDGIGPSLSRVVRPDSPQGEPRLTGLVDAAHRAGLEVHAWTLRRDAGQVPGYARDFDHLLSIFLNQAGVDGVFTDFPDLATRHRGHPHTW